MNKRMVENLESKFQIAKMAIASGQRVEIFSDYYPQEGKIILRVEIFKANKEFLTLEPRMLSREQADRLSGMHNSEGN